MSPEQSIGGEVDPRSDLWSLGAVLREMLAVRTPAIDRVLSLMLAREPEDRYPDAAALLPDLAALQREAGGVKEAPRPPHRKGWFLALAALCLGAFAAAHRLLEPSDSANPANPPVNR